MCATNIWAVNAAASTPEFVRFTQERLGVAPEPAPFRIASSRVRDSSSVFTLTTRMCDCTSLIGAKQDAVPDGEITAEQWLGWLRDMPDHVPHVARLAVLRAWSPEDDVVRPARARDIRIHEATEDILRGVGDDHLLTIDYPRGV